MVGKMTQKGMPAGVSVRAGNVYVQQHNTAPVSIFGCACSPNFARSLCLNIVAVLLYCCNLPVFKSVYLQGFQV